MCLSSGGAAQHGVRQHYWMSQLVKSVSDGEFSNGSKGSACHCWLVKSWCHPLMIPTEGENGMVRKCPFLFKFLASCDFPPHPLHYDMPKPVRSTWLRWVTESKRAVRPSELTHPREIFAGSCSLTWPDSGLEAVCNPYMCLCFCHVLCWSSGTGGLLETTLHLCFQA